MKPLLIAVQGLRAAPVRNTLVILTLWLGMLGLMAVLSATDILRQTVLQRAELQGGREATVSSSVSGLRNLEGFEAARQLLDKRIGATASTLTLNDPNVVLQREGESALDATVTFIGDGLLEVRPFPIISGSWLPQEQLLAPRAVVNERAWSDIGGASLSVSNGQQRLPLLVVGVIRDGNEHPTVYLSINAATELGADITLTQFLFQGLHLTPELLSSAGEELTRLGGAFTLTDPQRTDTGYLLTRELDSTARTLLVLGVLSLGATVVGITNVGLSAASMRAKEFTLRRATGASRWQIAVIVMLESQLLAVLAAGIAALTTWLVHPLLSGALVDEAGIRPPPFDARFILLGWLIAALTAAVGNLAAAVLSYRRAMAYAMRE